MEVTVPRSRPWSHGERMELMGIQSLVLKRVDLCLMKGLSGAT